jgi:hypothetical protein
VLPKFGVEGRGRWKSQLPKRIKCEYMQGTETERVTCEKRVASDGHGRKSCDKTWIAVLEH